MSTALIRPRVPPGPKGTIIGGNIRQLRAGPLDFFLSTAREYGPLASFRLGPRRVFLATTPDLIEQVLVTDAKHYIKHFGARAFGDRGKCDLHRSGPRRDAPPASGVIFLQPHAWGTARNRGE